MSREQYVRTQRALALSALLVLGACATRQSNAVAPVAQTPSPIARNSEPSGAAHTDARVFAESAPTAVAAPQTPVPLPATVDLREQLLAWKLAPRAQGARGTCSIFTTCESIEFALARASGVPRRLSPEFVNWAGARVIGRPSDGNFFHNALAGFERFGVCGEEALPYREPFDPNLAPSQTALDEAAELRDATRASLVVHWIVPWEAAHRGVSNEQLAEIRSVLARGYPVAAGSGHSRLLVGYRDDATSEGGGVFVTEDSALARFDEVTYDFVRTQVCDVFWIEGAPNPTARK